MGLVVLQNATTFNVLDVYVKDGATQVFLTTESISESYLIQAARSDLDEFFTQPPVPALTVSDWMERVIAPVGLDDNGNPFPITMS